MEFILVFLCLGAGIWVSKLPTYPKDGFRAVNLYIIYLALPAVSLRYMPDIVWSKDIIFPFIMPLVVWISAWAVSLLLKKYLHLDKKTFAAIWITIGLCNTSFIGFPLTQLYYGEAGLKIAVLCDQASFIIVSVLGLFTAVKYSNKGTPNPMAVLKKILLFPAFIAFLLSALFPMFIKSLNLDKIIIPLAGSLVPVALFSVGLQLKLSNLSSIHKTILSSSLFFKLVAAPALVLIIGLLIPIKGLDLQVTVFESAMAPMVTGVIIANDYKLNPLVSNAVLGLGILLSFPSSYLWQLVLNLLT